MNIEEQLQQLSRQTCPQQVDVVDAVMAQVRRHPYLRPVHKNTAVWRAAALTAAAVAAIVVFNVATVHSYDEDQISEMMAYVSDYDSYLSVESAAEPLDYIYGDLETDD